MNKKQIIKKLKEEKNRLTTYGISIAIIAAGGVGVSLANCNKSNIEAHMVTEKEKDFSFEDLKDAIVIKKSNTFFLTEKTIYNNTYYTYKDILTDITVVDIDITKEANDIIEGKKETMSVKEYGTFSDLVLSEDQYKNSYKESELKNILSNIEKSNNKNKTYSK